MKLPLVAAIVVSVLVVGAATFTTACRLRERMIRLQEGSQAGSTLQSVARAVALHRLETGAYPESLEGLHVENTGGDFSAAALRHVIYRKTETGFIAFVGVPGVAYVDERQTPQHEDTR